MQNLFIHVSLALGLFASRSSAAQSITEVIDTTGDGTQGLVQVTGLALDSLGNLFACGQSTSNVFRITDPCGARVITEFLDSTGDGAGHPLHHARNVAVDSSDNFYVIGYSSQNVLKVTPGGSITQIIDATGDGTHPLFSPEGVIADASGNVYVAGWWTDNVFRITPSGGITQIIDAAGDGVNALDGPASIGLDGAGNVYVSAQHSDNAFRITPAGVVTQILDASGDGAGHALDRPWGIAVGVTGNVYVAGTFSHNVLRVTPGGVITEIIGSAGDGAGNTLRVPAGLALDGAENVYVTGSDSDNAFRISDPGGANVVVEIIDGAGDGAGNALDYPVRIETDRSGNVYVGGFESNNVFKIDLDCGLLYCDRSPDNSAEISIDTCACAAGSIHVRMTGGPPDQFGYLLVSATSGSTTNPPGAQGDLCLAGGAIGGYVQDLGTLDASGTLTTDILNANTGGGSGNLPTPPGGNLCATAGQTWNFQYWHRDGSNASRFSKAITATFH